jgi:hypothetical protein
MNGPLQIVHAVSSSTVAKKPVYAPYREHVPPDVTAA